MRYVDWEAEIRIAVVRAVAVVALFAVALGWFGALPAPTDAEKEFLRRAMAIAGLGIATSAVALATRRTLYYPPWTPFLTTGADILLVAMAAGVGRGPQAPVLVGLFLAILSTTIRARLSVVWFATLLAMAAYVSLVATRDPVWFDADHATPVADQLTWLASLACAGLFAGQSIRRGESTARKLALIEVETRRPT